MFLLLLIAVPTQAFADSSFGPYKGKVLRVVDGDTLQLSVEVWPGLFEKTLFRIKGVNAPEIHERVSPCEKEAGLKAKKFVEDFVAGADYVTVDNIGKEKYGRALGNLFVGEISLGAALLNAGLAVEYHGGKRTPWVCDK